MSTLLALRDVHMSYRVASDHEAGSHKVLDGIDVSLSPGDRLGVVGNNGAGKSTLLRIMAKIVAPLSGRVEWGDNVSVSLLSLGLGFRDDLTGRENAFLSMVLQGFSRKDARHVLGDIEAFCELGDYFDEPVKRYSSGMRARLGFATALLNRSQVLLVDEVLGVGDASFRKKARIALTQRLDDGRGVVLVSHSDIQICNLCTRAIWLDAGGIRESGTPVAVTKAYAAEAAAR